MNIICCILAILHFPPRSDAVGWSAVAFPSHIYTFNIILVILVILTFVEIYR